MTPDLINGIFEFFGFVAALLNIRRLLRDKVVRGIHWGSIAFFSTWGYWNLYYYPSLDQFYSFAAGALLAAANTVWVVLALYIDS